MAYNHSHYTADKSKLVSSMNTRYFPLERENIRYQFLIYLLHIVCNCLNIRMLHLQGKGTQPHIPTGLQCRVQQPSRGFVSEALRGFEMQQGTRSGRTWCHFLDPLRQSILRPNNLTLSFYCWWQQQSRCYFNIVNVLESCHF